MSFVKLYKLLNLLYVFILLPSFLAVSDSEHEPPRKKRKYTSVWEDNPSSLGDMSMDVITKTLYKKYEAKIPKELETSFKSLESSVYGFINELEEENDARPMEIMGYISLADMLMKKLSLENVSHLNIVLVDYIIKDAGYIFKEYEKNVYEWESDNLNGQEHADTMAKDFDVAMTALKNFLYEIVPVIESDLSELRERLPTQIFNSIESRIIKFLNKTLRGLLGLKQKELSDRNDGKKSEQ
ncbi:hypothetical protein THOM_0682 [Trachipleistophora hominis]|uniref:Uncharacterized protein n=1 Tax=Trachipleistophora hominis TaxID=72359 RepID=L7JY57_TRAHO|nr:hypothetical protein THOM_0682 [Trachipleistophora hominis]